MDMPSVSVCIPNYNNAKYLESCIQSTLAQTYQNTEVVLVDDCSTDNSLEIANKYKDQIRVFFNSTNLGQPKNTNKSIECSTGKYLVILHSDDLLLPNFIEKLVPILESYPNVGIAIGERMTTDETGNFTKVAPLYKTSCIIPGEKQAKVFMMTSVLPCQVLLRRDVFLKVGRIDERYIVNLDGLMWFKCALISDVGYIQTPVSVYRNHAENTTAQYNQSIDLMVEYYCTLAEMFRLAKWRSYLEDFFSAAVKRAGHLTLRYIHSVFRSKNLELAKRWLALAIVYDPDLINNHTYKTLKYCVESDGADWFQLYQRLIDTMEPEVRQFSYDPPEDFVPYDN
ncbi:MAG TPA: glycosyltransferase [Victivallales bacterium]|nr:glycosyltransferase [Victivallales bacterium]